MKFCYQSRILLRIAASRISAAELAIKENRFDISKKYILEALEIYKVYFINAKQTQVDMFGSNYVVNYERDG